MTITCWADQPFLQDSWQYAKNLKQKLDLQADQLEQARCRVANMEKSVVSGRREVHWLRKRVSQLQEAQHVAKSTAARGYHS